MHYFVPPTIKMGVLSFWCLKITQIPKYSPLSQDLPEVFFQVASFAFSLLRSDSRFVFLLCSSLMLSDLGDGLAQTWRLPVLFEETVFLYFSLVIVILFLRADVL